MEISQKIEVIKKIAKVLNDNHITWAVGASFLLYLKGKTVTFHDVDILVIEEDAEKLKALLSPMGTLAMANPNELYKTKHFLEFCIDEVEIDVMAGFVIVHDGKEWDCSLKPDQIVDYYDLDGIQIPLQSLELWKHYYTLMDRDEKVEMIEK